jgi:hypothetical protein
VTPGWIGLGTIPPPVLNVAEAFPHDPAVALLVSARSRIPVIVWVIGTRKDGNREVFPSRELPGDGEEHTLLWTVDERIGRGGDFVGFKISIGQRTPVETADYYAVSFGTITVAGVQTLSDEEVLAASSYTPLILELTAPRPGTPSMKGVMAVPSALAARYLGGKLVVRDGDENVIEAVIDQPQTTSRGLFMKEFVLPIRGAAGETRRVELSLAKDDGSLFILGSATYKPVTEEIARRQGEVPFQDILSYAVDPSGPDLGVVTVVRDLYARLEPRGGETMTHELLANTVSLESGLFELQPAWRVPAFAHWAEAGFRTVSVEEINDAVAIFVTGADGRGLEQLGLASAAGRSAVRPAINNPIFAPAPDYTGWTDGQPSSLRGNAVIPYGRSYALVALVQAAENPVRTITGLSTGLRDFADAGVIDINPTHTAGGLGHLDATQRAGVTYLLADDPGALWTSTDPLRRWERHDAAFPAEWSSFRLRRVGDADYLFGLAEHEGKRVVRWTAVEYRGDGAALPHVVKDPTMPSGSAQ